MYIYPELQDFHCTNGTASWIWKFSLGKPPDILSIAA
jgi:hypothetical protein